MRKSRNKRSPDSYEAEQVCVDRTRVAKISKRLRLSGRRIATLLIFAGTAGAIVFNAVVLQPARHPAPLFAAVDAARAVQEKTANVVPTPVRPAREQNLVKPLEEKPPLKLERAAVERPAEKTERPADKIEKLIEKTEKPQPKAQQVAALPAVQQKATQRSPQNDTLGEFIRAGIVPPASIPNEPNARVIAIQKNLQRLGYAVGKPDGMMGSGTRAAIEKFERDRKWPVSGEMTQRLMRELGTVSAGKRD